MADQPYTPSTMHHSTTFDKNKTPTYTAHTTSQSHPQLFSYLSTPLQPPLFRRPAQSFKASNSPHKQSLASAPSSMASNETKKLDINSLMSPPDHVLDSFNQNTQHTIMVNCGADNGLRPASLGAKHPMPMSPPISPYNNAIHNTSEVPVTPASQLVKDPVLYPVEDTAPSSPPQPPLFAPIETETHQHIVDDHVRARSLGSFISVNPPKREDYELALSFRCRMMRAYTASPKAWLQRERALLIADQRAKGRRHYPIAPARPLPMAKPIRTHRADRVSKPVPAPRPIRTHPVGTPAPMRPAAAPRVSATPEPSRRVVAPNREDKDFKSLPNYCPPLDSLPSRPNSLKVDWKGQPIDLSSDPYASLLHPDEVALAGNLRLDCATYLTSKRRIFERRLQCLRSGKEFRKTDAQQACKIDVNKASKLWTAFDKVGWLDAQHVQHFL